MGSLPRFVSGMLTDYHITSRKILQVAFADNSTKPCKYQKTESSTDPVVLTHSTFPSLPRQI